ncbi:hypothetical protein LCGC14_1731420, partial [marine sediment metagenome]
KIDNHPALVFLYDLRGVVSGNKPAGKIYLKWLFFCFWHYLLEFLVWFTNNINHAL